MFLVHRTTVNRVSGVTLVDVKGDYTRERLQCRVNGAELDSGFRVTGHWSPGHGSPGQKFDRVLFDHKSAYQIQYWTRQILLYFQSCCPYYTKYGTFID